MPLGTEVDLGPGQIVLNGVPAPAKGAQQPPPLFSAHVFAVPNITITNVPIVILLYKGLELPT